MAAVYRMFEDLNIKLKTIKTYTTVGIGSHDDIEKVRNIYIKHMRDAIRLVNYCENILDSNEYVTSLRNNLYEIYDHLYSSDSIDNMKALMSYIVDNEEQWAGNLERIRPWFAKSVIYDMRHETYFRDNYSNEDLAPIIQNISSDKPLNIFSIQCMSGTNEEFIKESLKSLNNINVRTYALCQEDLKDDIKPHINRTILGQLKGSIISNNAFDIVYANPIISIVTQHDHKNKLKIRNEEYILNSTVRYLKPGGLLVYSVPFYSISSSMFLFLAKNFSNINIIKPKTNNKEKLDLCYATILATKKLNSKYSSTFNELITMTYDDLDTEPSTIYDLDLPDVEISLFRGSVLDEDELSEIILNDGIFDEFLTSLDRDENNKDTRPLLPFNIGQVGLILSSGSLDGIVEEPDGTKHVIKGMTIKETDSSSEFRTENGVTITESTEVIRNKVQITAIDSDGTIYNLT